MEGLEGMTRHVIFQGEACPNPGSQHAKVFRCHCLSGGGSSQGRAQEDSLWQEWQPAGAPPPRPLGELKREGHEQGLLGTPQ